MTALALGNRVRITGRMPDEPDPLPVGATGIVSRVANAAGQVWVRWEPPNETRSLMLLVGVDPFEVVPGGAYAVEGAGWCCPHGNGPEGTVEAALAACPECSR